jgi:predicted ATPase
MINYINIKNFKSLKNIYLKPTNLNLCFGMNGMGKSSLLQIFLLLRQSCFKGTLQNTGLLLQGGELVTIGTGKDAFYQNAGKDETMTIAIKYAQGSEFVWQFCYEGASDILPLASFESNSQLQQASLFTHQFQYLSAEHLSPQKIYQKSAFEVTQHKNIGIKGEYAVHYLAHFGLNKINHPNLLHPNSSSEILLHQTMAWLSEITPGTKLNVEDLKGTDLVRMGIQFETFDGYTNDFLPINVGFGITYVLPLIVALLTAQANDLILIENPESHLHPKGQAVIGRLMALAAQNGVQILAESHSDHIINGVRVAVKEGLIDKDKVS